MKILDIEKQERKFLHKIYSAVLRERIWVRCPTKELYENTDKQEKIKQIYGHLCRVDENTN